jgi:hypothetical protein
MKDTHASPMLGLAHKAQPRKSGQGRFGVAKQRCLVALDGGHAEGLHVVDGRAEGDGAADVGRAGLELGWELRVGGLFKGDGQDHVPAALPGRHGIEQLPFAVENADAGGAVELVAREDQEVAIERLHVDLAVGHGLGRIDQNDRALAVGGFDHGLGGVDGAERIRDQGEGDELGLGPEELSRIPRG